MGKLIVDNRSFDVKDGDLIKEACREADIPFGCEEGICGTCMVNVLSGYQNLSKFTSEEMDFFGMEDGVIRLACQCRLTNGMVSVVSS